MCILAPMHYYSYMIREFKPDHSADPANGPLYFVRSEDKYRSLWQYIKRYQNSSFNNKLLKKRFPAMDNSLRKVKAQHTADALKQAEAYFNTARTSELAIKPLILYYGALNMVKALMMFTDNDLTLENTVQRVKGLNTHGLTNGASSPTDEAIRNDTTNLLEEFGLVTAVDKTVFSLLHGCWSNTPLPRGSRLELGDLASMHPNSWRSFKAHTGKPPKYFKIDGASFRTTARGEEHIVVFGGSFNSMLYQASMPVGQDNIFAFFENRLPQLGSLYSRETQPQSSFYTNGVPRNIDEYLPGYREPTGVQFVMGNPDVGQALHLIEVEFAMLFILGNLTRYAPQKWLDNVNYSNKGEMFVVEGFINSVAFSFPKLIFEELEEKNYTFTGDVAYWS
jgi:hypothetical protein